MFFLGGAGGWGWICFLGVGGWNTVQRNVNAIHRTSECYSWQRNLIAGGLFCFVCLFCFFVFFYFIFIIFSGEGVGLAFLGVVDGV